MTIETLEEARRAQEQMEDFAHLAHSVKLTVEQFENAFRELRDYPEALLESLCQLTDAAGAVAAIAADWAQVSNANFDPCRCFCKKCGARIPEKPRRDGAVLCWDCFYCASKHNGTLNTAHLYWQG
jgi:hypothetical protein